MDNEPVVSIIVTSYNYSQFIAECLHSCLSQSYSNIQVIVVDDNSTDGSQAVIEQFHKQDKRIVPVLLNKNEGYSHAKNEGIKVAAGEYIALIDADDKLTRESIRFRIEEFIRNPGLELVHGIALRWYGGADLRGYNKKTYIHAQGRMYHRIVFVKYGLYYEPLRSMSDKEFVYRIGVHPDSPFPKRINEKKINGVVAWYRKHNSQMHKVRRKNPKQNAAIKKMFKKRIKQLKTEGLTVDNTRWM